MGKETNLNDVAKCNLKQDFKDYVSDAVASEIMNTEYHEIDYDLIYNIVYKNLEIYEK